MVQAVLLIQHWTTQNGIDNLVQTHAGRLVGVVLVTVLVETRVSV